MEQFKFKFSIIMAVYNAEEFLEEAVESILQQDIGFKENVQLIFVDDGSQDKSGAICDNYAQKYPENIVVVHKENGGVASARNAGIPYADGRYLNFMDSDDKITGNVLSEVYKFFIKHEEETDIVAIPVFFFGRQKGEHYLNYKFKKGNRIIDLYKEYDATLRFTNSSFFSNCCKSEMNFDDRLVVGEDVKFILSLLYRKMKIGVISSCRYMYRKHGSGLVDLSKVTYGYYFDYFTYLTDWVKGFYKEKLGFVPEYIQYETMIELAWRTRGNYTGSVLTAEEMEQYKKILFEHYKDIDDRYILEQRHIGKEHKSFILSKKYECNPQVMMCCNDALVHFGSSIIGWISDCCVVIECIEYKDKVLYLEGFTRILGNDNDEKIDVYVLCKGEKISCELTVREDVSVICFGEVMYKGIGFKCRIPMGNMPEQGEIKSGITFRGMDIIKKDFRLGTFSSIAKDLKNSYYYADNMIITSRSNMLLWHRGTEQDAKATESMLLKELWQSGITAAKKAAVSRYLYHRLKPLLKKEILLLSGGINKEDDNSAALFRYINENKASVNIYYVLPKDGINHTNYIDLEKLGKRVDYMSWKHKFLYLLADKIISTTADEYIHNPFQKNEKYYRDILAKKQRILL